MSKRIVLEIPAEPEYQKAAAAFFNTLNGHAVELDRQGTTTGRIHIEKKVVEKELSPGISEITKDDAPPPPPPSEELSAVDTDSVFSGTGEPGEKVDDGVERDAAGFPWDERIHSGNKKKYSDGSARGTWFRRRGVTPDTTNQVEAELLASGAAVDLKELELMSRTTQDDAPPTPPPELKVVQNDTPPPPPGAAKSVENFPELMALVLTLKSAGKITYAQINEQATAVAGVPNVALMATKKDLIPALGAAIQAVAGV